MFSKENNISSRIKDELETSIGGVTKDIGKIALATVIALSTVNSARVFAETQKRERPNILFILTDNQPPSTLGCYGNKNIYTPNIDRLAVQGMQFQNAYACNGMSSPTRASLMTGLIPSQHGVHTQLSDALKSTWPKEWCCISEFRTLPQTLSDNGYKTALIGKYHLGIPDKPHLKFDYWVTFPEGHTWCFYGNEIIDNDKTYNYPGHITELWTQKTIEYLNNYKGDKPFFLYLAYDAPYGLPPSIYGPAKNRFAGLYANKEMPSSPQLAVNKMMKYFVLKGREYYGDGHGKWIETLLDTLNDLESIRNYASQTTLVDYGIGQVLDTLKQNGLDENTLIILSSDQGIAYGQKGFWGQTENSIPSNLYETPVRVPLIFRHTGQISPIQTTELLVNDYDILPTILDYIRLGGIKIANTPGKSFAPLLKGEKLKWDSNAIFMEQEVTRAVRDGKWKYIKRCPKVVDELFSTKHEPGKYKGADISQYPNYPMVLKTYAPPSYGDELYNLQEDPEENNNLANDPQYASIKKKLNDQLTAFFDTYADPQYDLWKGGTVKSNSNVPYIWKAVWPGWEPVTKEVEHPFSDK